MKVWLVKVGEDLPLPGFDSRLMRTGLLAKELSDRGHDVTWFTSSFRHHNKSFYSTQDQRVDLSSNYRIQLMHAMGYEKHVSFRRLWNHHRLGKKLSRYVHSSRYPLPDVIYAAVPILETAKVAIDFAKANNIPCVVDARDMWPDQYLEAFPQAFSSLARIGLEPYYAMARSIFGKADSVCGITDEFVDWGLSKTKRSRLPKDVSFPLSIVLSDLKEENKKAAELFWKSKGVDLKKPIALYAGSFSRCFDFEPIIIAAEALEQTDLQFVLCGDGDYLESVQSACSHLKNVTFPGWIDQSEIQLIEESADIGLAPYSSLPPFLKSIPNKLIEYMGRGMYCFSSLEGISKALFEETGAGTFYDRHSKNELAICLEGFLKRPHEEKRFFTARAKKLFHSRFDGNKIYSDFADHLETLGGNRAHASLPSRAGGSSA